MTAAKLRELEVKATGGVWEVLPCSNGGKLLVRGNKMNKSTQMMPDADPELIACLRNHCSDFIKLIEAAEKFIAAEDAPRVDDFVPTIESLNDRIQARDDLREAVAAFKEKS